MSQIAEELSFAALGVHSFKKFMVFLLLFRTISGSESYSILLSLNIVPRYNFVWSHGVSQKCKKLPFLFGPF